MAFWDLRLPPIPLGTKVESKACCMERENYPLPSEETAVAHRWGSLRPAGRVRSELEFTADEEPERGCGQEPVEGLKRGPISRQAIVGSGLGGKRSRDSFELEQRAASLFRAGYQDRRHGLHYSAEAPHRGDMVTPLTARGLNPSTKKGRLKLNRLHREGCDPRKVKDHICGSLFFRLDFVYQGGGIIVGVGGCCLASRLSCPLRQRV